MSVVTALRETFGEAIGLDLEFRGQLIVWIEQPAQIAAVCSFLRDDPRFQYRYLSDLSAIDRLTMEQESLPTGHDPAEMTGARRFVVNYQLLSMTHKQRLWLKVGLGAEAPSLPSVTPVWTTADFLEREVYDLMGIAFEGHPDLRRILLPDDWAGHPLRKDYPPAYEEVQFSHNFERIEKQRKYARR
ncbi:MAG: NADH-quinone oxidoreductase subunit C [Chloroflexi bacterium]|nr:NADH-quinone oxidoreductase subunit C [Chloroflexota bacterium]